MPQAVFVGPQGVTTSTGYDIPAVANASISIKGEAAIYGIVALGTQGVSFIEWF